MFALRLHTHPPSSYSLPRHTYLLTALFTTVDDKIYFKKKIESDTYLASMPVHAPNLDTINEIKSIKLSAG
jgi:hypothetical protein